MRNISYSALSRKIRLLDYTAFVYDDSTQVMFSGGEMDMYSLLPYRKADIFSICNMCELPDIKQIMQDYYLYVSLVIMKYKVHIEETLAKDVYVEAKTRQDAYNYVQDKMDQEEIVLTADDYTGCRFVEVYPASPLESKEKKFIQP